MEEEELHLYPQPWTFPVEIISHIMAMVARHGKLQDLRNCMLVCSAWKEATAYGYVWQILFRTKWRWFYPTMCKQVKQKQPPSTSNEPKRRPNKKYKQKSAPPPRWHVSDNILWRKACQERMLKLRGQKEQIRLLHDRTFIYKDIYSFKISESGEHIAFGTTRYGWATNFLAICSNPLYAPPHNPEDEMGTRACMIFPHSTNGYPRWHVGPISWLKGDPTKVASAVTEDDQNYDSPRKTEVLIHEIEAEKVVCSISMESLTRVITMKTVKANVKCMQADHNKVVVGTSPGAILVYDLRKKNSSINAPIWKWEDETASIKTLQFHNNLLVAGSHDGTIKKFDWRMSKKKNQSPVMAALSGPVEKIAFEGNLLASVTAGQHAYTFDLSTGAEIASFWLTDLAAEPKVNNFHLDAANERIVYSTMTGTLLAINMHNLKRIQEFKGLQTMCKNQHPPLPSGELHGDYFFGGTDCNSFGYMLLQ